MPASECGLPLPDLKPLRAFFNSRSLLDSGQQAAGSRHRVRFAEGHLHGGSSSNGQLLSARPMYRRMDSRF